MRSSPRIPGCPRARRLAIASLLACLVGAGCGGPSAPGGASAPGEDDPHAALPPTDVKIREVEETVAATSLFRREAGPPGGDPVVLLHGGRFHSGTWLELGTIERLASHGYRVIALDLPGFGRSEATREERGAWLASFFDHAEIDHAVLLAASMSGSFAFPFLRDHEDRVAGFVAVAPVGIDGFVRATENPRALPAWLVWGENDRTIPVAESEVLAKAFRNPRTTILDGASHPCYLDRPDAFHEGLESFLQRAFRVDPEAGAAADGREDE